MSFETTRYKSAQTRIVNSLSERAQSAPNQVTDYVSSEILSEFTLPVDRQLVMQAFNTLRRIDRDLMDARAQFNDDWFRRTMRARRHAVSRLRRRWNQQNPPPVIPLGCFRRHFHANIAGYLYLEDIHND